MLVGILYESGRLPEAKIEAETLLPKLEPRSDDEQATRLILGRILLEEGAVQAATEVVKHAASSANQTELAKLRFELAEALNEEGLIDESIEEYGRALNGLAQAEGPFAFNALLSISRLLNQLGDESSGWVDRPWFGLYRKIGDLLQSLE
jgi:tetratricopeptide (TPR) repeat protein